MRYNIATVIDIWIHVHDKLGNPDGMTYTSFDLQELPHEAHAQVIH